MCKLGKKELPISKERTKDPWAAVYTFNTSDFFFSMPPREKDFWATLTFSLSFGMQTQRRAAIAEEGTQGAGWTVERGPLCLRNAWQLKLDCFSWTWKGKRSQWEQAWELKINNVHSGSSGLDKMRPTLAISFGPRTMFERIFRTTGALRNPLKWPNLTSSSATRNENFEINLSASWICCRIPNWVT